MAQCKMIKDNWKQCGAHTVKDSDYCWFHSDAVKDNRGHERGLKLEMGRPMVIN